jgi:hypothetical protein
MLISWMMYVFGLPTSFTVEKIMQYPVIVRSESEDQYTAQPLGMAELSATATTEVDAIELVSQALSRWLASAKVVTVDVPTTRHSNPWLDSFGRSTDDPDFDEFAAELQRIHSSANSE